MKTLKNNTRLNIETLETRVVMDASCFSASVGDNGLLSIQGTSANDVVRVTEVLEGETYAVEINGTVQTIDAAVSQILFSGNGGMDSFVNETPLLSVANANCALTIKGTTDDEWVEIHPANEHELTLEFWSSKLLVDADVSSILFDGQGGKDHFKNTTDLPTINVSHGGSELGPVINDSDAGKEMTDDEWDQQMELLFDEEPVEDTAADYNTEDYISEHEYPVEQGSDYEMPAEDADSEFEMTEDEENLMVNSVSDTKDNSPKPDPYDDADQDSTFEQDEDASEYDLYVGNDN